MTTVDKSTKVYSTFDPRVIPNCALWLDGADLNTFTLSGSNVTTWKDKSVNAYNASTGTTSPTYSSRSVVFNGTTQYLTTNYSASLQSESLFVVATLTATPSGGRTMFGSSSNGGRQFFTWNATIQANNQGVAAGPAGGTVTQNALSLFEYTSTSGSPNNTINLYINGTSAVSGTLANYTTSLTSWIGRWPGSGTEGWVGPIYEIVAFDRTLTTTERQQVEGYLAWKWGLQASLPVGHPYVSSIKHGPYLSPFRPKDISNCAFWIDAKDQSTITYSTAPAISSVRDKSDSAKSFTVGATVNYNSTDVSFDFTASTNGRFDFNVTGSFMPENTYDCVFVCTINTSINLYRALIRADNTAIAPGIDIFVSDYGTNNIGAWTGMGSVGFSQFGSMTQSPGTKAMYYVTVNLSKQIQAAQNGGLTLSTATTATNYSGRIITIGNDYAGGQAFGRLHEFVLISRNISTAERQQLEGYMAWRWNLQSSLPSTHPFRNFPPLKVN